MKLAFHQRGKQFLFYTFCLAGRPKRLSRLEAGAKRPLLTAEGEAVRALMRSLHRLDASLTASEYCIMPDHVHFLLIVDCDRRAEPFRPLVFAHWWMEASAAVIQAAAGAQAAAAAAVPARDGGCAPAPLPEAPRGVRGAASPPSLASAIEAALPTTIRNHYYGEGLAAPAGPWEDRFWMDLSLSPRQLAAIRAYIRGNPARALWKAAHPDAFARHAGFRHRALDPRERWSAYGCLPLLASPFLFHVRLTRRLSAEAQEPAIAEAVERARGGWIPVGGFLSPAEKEVERRLRAEPRARCIKLLPHGLAPRFDPSLADSRMLAEGRLLILSPFPESVPLKPISRSNCLRLNELAADIAARAQADQAAAGAEAAASAAGAAVPARDGGLPPPAPPATEAPTAAEAAPAENTL